MTPAKKHPINVQAAALDENPPFCKEDFADGSMLYKEEKI